MRFFKSLSICFALHVAIFRLGAHTQQSLGNPAPLTWPAGSLLGTGAGGNSPGLANGLLCCDSGLTTAEPGLLCCDCGLTTIDPNITFSDCCDTSAGGIMQGEGGPISSRMCAKPPAVCALEAGIANGVTGGVGHVDESSSAPKKINGAGKSSCFPPAPTASESAAPASAAPVSAAPQSAAPTSAACESVARASSAPASADPEISSRFSCVGDTTGQSAPPGHPAGKAAGEANG